MRRGANPLSTEALMDTSMETFMQKLAKKKEPATLTILPVLQEEREHGTTCDCGEAGCGDGADGGCCGA